MTTAQPCHETDVATILERGGGNARQRDWIYIYIYIYISATALAVCVSRAQYIIIKIYNIVYRIDIGDPPANWKNQHRFLHNPPMRNRVFGLRCAKKQSRRRDTPWHPRPFFFGGGVGALFRWSCQLVCMYCFMIIMRPHDLLKGCSRSVQDGPRTDPRGSRRLQEPSRAVRTFARPPPPGTPRTPCFTGQNQLFC